MAIGGGSSGGILGHGGGSGGLLRDPQRYLTDPTAQRSLAVQLAILGALLAISAYSHFFLHNRKRSSYPSAAAEVEQNETAGAYEEVVAEVDRLMVYPIKSCAGCVVSKQGEGMQLDRKGFQYDRRWMVVRPMRKENGTVKWEKQSLREEPRLTLIQPELVEESGHTRAVLRLSISERSTASPLPPAIEVPLRPTRDVLDAWEAVCDVEMWGDVADGRIVEMDSTYNGTFTKSPSAWISEFLGYEAMLLQFDDKARGPRQPFPIWKPPASSTAWNDSRRAALGGPTGIEFQDEYPLLVSTVESLTSVQAQIQAAVLDNEKLKSLDRDHWRTATQDEAHDVSLKMLAFRPNVVLRSKPGTHGFPPFSEDSWETIWIGPDVAQEEENGVKEIQLKQNEEEEEKKLSSGSITACLNLVARCKRCRLTTVDPITAKQDKNVPLAMLRETRYRKSEAKKAGPCFGMYAVPEAMPLDVAAATTNQLVDPAGKEKDYYGTLTVGDAVRVRWRPYALDDEVMRKRE